MELFLDNIGIIKNATVKVEGLTVITGKNSSGKTTVGKVLYSLIRANGDIEKAFETSRDSYIVNKLSEVSNLISARRVFELALKRKEDLSSKHEELLAILGSRSYRNFGSEKLLSCLYEVQDMLTTLTLLDIYEFSNKEYASISRHLPAFQRTEEQFEERKKIAINVCSQAIHTIEDDRVFDIFSLERLKTFLNLSFGNQIRPVRDTKSVGYIRLEQAGAILIDLQIRSKSDFKLSKEVPAILPYTETVFIDDPFIIDRLVTGSSDLLLVSENEDVIVSVDATSHRDYLIKLLTVKTTGNFFDNLELQKKYNEVIEKINLIVPGEFQETKEGMFYVDENAKLNVQNLATGSKLFFIIKMLLMNGKLNDNTVLILDEPESHLHPEWINKFAEILVLLIKELKLRILLTTHSPNLLLALEWFSKSYSIKEQSHFYLARALEEREWASTLDCIDDNINKGYAHLSLPLVEMSIKQKAAAEEEF